MADPFPQWPKTTPAYQQLKKQIETDREFYIVLEASLIVAVTRAGYEINSDLYHAIDHEFTGSGWPTTPEAYLEYIEKYLVLIPNEEIDSMYPEAWTSTDTSNGYNQKVYDLLCHFYFLVDQEVPGIDKTLQNYKHDGFDFAEWLREFAVDWGKFLDTEESLTLTTLASFIADPMYNIPLYKDNAKKWNSFNTFFYREFNGANENGQTNLRPIAEPDNNNAIVSSADCTFKAVYPIDQDGNVLGMDGQPTAVNLKNTHAVYNVAELLDDPELAEHFKGGTFVHYFLSPFDYHRFHSPAKGTVKACKHVQGKVYLDVTTTDGQFDAPDSAVGGYEFSQSRGVFVVDTGGPVGMVASVPIGMAQVSGVNMYTDKLLGNDVRKGDEFGCFMFGGSDTILLFQENPNLYLWKNDPGHAPIHFQFGQVAAYWNVDEQH